MAPKPTWVKGIFRKTKSESSGLTAPLIDGSVLHGSVVVEDRAAEVKKPMTLTLRDRNEFMNVALKVMLPLYIYFEFIKLSTFYREMYSILIYL